VVWLLATIDPVIDDGSFLGAMALLGAGMGLLASQLGDVVQSGAGDAERSEVGGLQFTAQNLGSSLGTAFIGSLLIGALATAFATRVEDDPRISDAARTSSVGTKAIPASSAMPVSCRAAAERAGLPPAEVEALADSYASAQLDGLRAGILAAGGITLASLLVTGNLPATRSVKGAGAPGRP
ncbi:MFS transporter, partial [Streptomyces sp. t39]